MKVLLRLMGGHMKLRAAILVVALSILPAIADTEPPLTGQWTWSHRIIQNQSGKMTEPRKDTGPGEAYLFLPNGQCVWARHWRAEFSILIYRYTLSGGILTLTGSPPSTDTDFFRKLRVRFDTTTETQYVGDRGYPLTIQWLYLTQDTPGGGTWTNVYQRPK
jgi:hypothetical protein